MTIVKPFSALGETIAINFTFDYSPAPERLRAVSADLTLAGQAATGSAAAPSATPAPPMHVDIDRSKATKFDFTKQGINCAGSFQLVELSSNGGGVLADIRYGPRNGYRFLGVCVTFDLLVQPSPAQN